MAVAITKTISVTRARSEQILSACTGGAAGLMFSFALSGFILVAPVAKTMAFALAALCGIFFFFAEGRKLRVSGSRHAIRFQVFGSLLVVTLVIFVIHNFFQISMPLN